MDFINYVSLGVSAFTALWLAYEKFYVAKHASLTGEGSFITSISGSAVSLVNEYQEQVNNLNEKVKELQAEVRELQIENADLRRQVDLLRFAKRRTTRPLG